MSDLRHAFAVFEQVCDRDPAEREALIAQACANDPELAALVRSILSRDTSPVNGAGGPESSPPESDGEGHKIPPMPAGTRIGRYTIIRMLGRGGCGVVYLAEQHAPDRQVALKVIIPEYASPMLARRFRDEQQALASVDHPAISHLYDAGTTAPDETGAGAAQPYFVMEYVSGMPIDEHCDAQRLSIRQRVELFIRVCEGVQHAHLRLIIHRDLKPSNILVQTGGAPKVIDFGIAKVLGAPGGGGPAEAATLRGLPIGTPAYMSPEQAAGGAVDIRTDVFALGVVLHQLLVKELPAPRRTSARTPWAPAGRAQGGSAEEEAIPPSERLNTLLARITPAQREDLLASRGATLAELRRSVREDLDWIVLRALEDNPERRYQNVDALIADLRAHLDGRAVQARQPPLRYRVRKFVRRYKGAVAATAALGLAVGAGVVSTEAQRREATRRARDLERVVKFQAHLLDIDTGDAAARIAQVLDRNAVRRGENLGLSQAEIDRTAAGLSRTLSELDLPGVAAELIRLEVLDPATKTIETDYAELPLVQASLYQGVAQSLTAIGAYSAAEGPQRRALEIRRSWLGARHRATIESGSALGTVLSNLGQFAEAEKQYRLALAAAEDSLGRRDELRLSALGELAAALHFGGKLAEAEQCYQRAADESLRYLGERSEVTLTAEDNLANFLRDTGRADKALPWAAASFAGHREVFGPDHRDTLMAQSNYAKVLDALGWDWESEVLLRLTLDMRRRKLGQQHPSTLLSVQALGLWLDKRGRVSEAEAFMKEAYGGARNNPALGPGHPHTLSFAGTLASVYEDQGRFDAAEPLLRAVYTGRLSRLGPEHGDTILAMGHLARFLESINRFEEAEFLVSEAARVDTATQGSHGPGLAGIHAVVCVNQGRPSDAVGVLEEALVRERSKKEPSTRGIRQMLETLKAVYQAWNRIEPSAERAAALAAISAELKFAADSERE